MTFVIKFISCKDTKLFCKQPYKHAEIFLTSFFIKCLVFQSIVLNFAAFLEKEETQSKLRQAFEKKL